MVNVALNNFNVVSSLKVWILKKELGLEYNKQIAGILILSFRARSPVF